MLELFKVVTARDYILQPEIDRHLCPLPQLEHGLRVLLQLILVYLQVLLEKGHFLVIAEVAHLRTGKLIFGHFLVIGLITDDIADLFEGELVSVHFADLFSLVSEQVTHGLQHTRELYHVVVSQVEDGIFPLFRTDRVVLFFLGSITVSCRFVRLAILAASKVL